MSCPDWKDVARRRDDGAEEAWEASLEHFDRCERCRNEALAAEPTLLFRRLPTVEVGPQDVVDMRRAVTSIRRARHRARLRSGQGWLRAAVAAGVVLGLASLEGVRTSFPEAAAPLGAVAALEILQLPLSEDPDGSLGPRIELRQEGLSVLVIQTPEL